MFEGDHEHFDQTQISDDERVFEAELNELLSKILPLVSYPAEDVEQY